MEVNYIIVQAGGKGTRMQQLTRNKPKALVPVRNLPMLFHLFRKFPEKKYLIIGDYKYEVLERYLQTFAEVDYTMVHAKGAQGTCGGLQDALKSIPPNEPFLLIWSDLILPDAYEMPKEDSNYVGISKDFPCRWRYEHGVFREKSSEAQGVAGLFIFEDASMLADVPLQGEFVRWLGERQIPFQELPLQKTKEYGVLSEYEKLETEKCRPFNRLTVEGSRIIKEGIDAQGRALAVRERAWYQKLAETDIQNIPKIYALEPLTMENIDGKNIYEYSSLLKEQKRDVLSRIIACLKEVQHTASVPSDWDSYYEAYIGKTFDRLNKIQDLVPFARDKTVTVNGRVCRNVFWERERLEQRIRAWFPAQFRLIHGDCTFSNLLLKQDGTPVLIDPRGYFGTTELYGDPAYDWAKLYYSIAGNYDQFNLKRFSLEIGEQEAALTIASSHWEDMEQDFFELLREEVTPEQLKLLHALIWLSLTTYAWEDYDSICGAFYNGLYYLEEVL